MLSIKGIYKDGQVVIQEEIKTDRPIDVIITTLDSLQLASALILKETTCTFITTDKLLRLFLQEELHVKTACQ